MSAAITLPEHALTPAQVAGRAGVNTNTVYDWIGRGVRVRGGRVRLRAVRVGGGWRVGEDALAEFLAAQNGGQRVEMAAQQTRARRVEEEGCRKAREMLGLPPRPG